MEDSVAFRTKNFLFYTVQGTPYNPPCPSTGPSPTSTTSVSALSVLSNASLIDRGPFQLHSPSLGTKVQQLWLLAEILTNNNDGKTGAHALYQWFRTSILLPLCTSEKTESIPLFNVQ